MNGRFHILSDGCIDTGWVHVYWTYTSRWSCRCWPTPGRSCTTGMPSEPSSFASPTPDSCSSCGELNAPPHRMTSFACVCVRWRPTTVHRVLDAGGAGAAEQDRFTIARVVT
jgi:hypothetical protein